MFCLQLASGSRHNFHQGPAIAQAHLTTLNLGQESDLLPAVLEGTSPPDLRNELVSWLDRGRESALELLDIAWVASSQSLQETVSSEVPARQAVHDSTAETHLLSRLRCSVEGVVIAIKSKMVSLSFPAVAIFKVACLPIQQSRFGSGLVANYSIRLLALRRREVFCCGTLWTTPVSLADEERTPDHLGVNLSRGLFNDALLCFDYTACLPLIIYTNDLGAELKGLTLRGRWEGLEEGNKSLAIYHTARVELRHAWNGNRSLTGIKVDNFLRGAFEG